MGLQTSNKRNPNFSMSSLTDIIFLLLIFFMLTSTFVIPNALNLTLPSGKGKVVTKQTISVSITRNLDYYVGNKQIGINSLSEELAKSLEGQTDPTVVLNAEKTVPIDNVVQVMSLAQKMGVKMILATSPNE